MPQTTETFLALPNVRQHIAAAAEYAAGKAAEAVREASECYLLENPVGSPIEAIFAAWWLAYSAEKHMCGDGLDLSAQHEVKVGEATYRLDLSVFHEDVDRAWKGHQYGIRGPDIGVELDGHEFHERTREQVERRNRRDRDLQAAGWTLFHFSGSGLVRDPIKAVSEVWSASEEAYGQFFRAVYAEDRRRGRTS